MEHKTQHKFKKRLTAAAITAGVLVLVLLLNIGFTLLTNRFHWQIDMTEEKFNEISSESTKLLDQLDPEENNISIYFLADIDQLRSPALGYPAYYYTDMGYEAPTTDLWGMKYIYDLAVSYADRYDFVNVETLHLRRDAGKLEAFRTTVASELTSLDVIVDNYTAEKDSDGNIIKDENGEPIMHHNFRIISRDNFFTYNSETAYVYAFKGEERFTSTILSLSGANPTVYFVSGHGEKVGDYEVGDFSSSGDYGEAQALRDLFFDAGYVTKKIDLDAEYKTLFEDETARILVLYGPQSDYSGDDAYGVGSVSEIDVLREFLFDADHHMMVFMDATEQPLTNLEEYLYDYWGVSCSEGLITDNGSNSLSDDGLSFITEYETGTSSPGYSLISQLTSLDSTPIIGIANARPILLNTKFTQKGGLDVGYSTTYAGAVMYAPSSASTGASDGDSSVSDENAGAHGDAVVTLSYEKLRDSDNNELYTYVLTSGSTALASEEMLEDTAYGNRDLLFYAMRLMGRETSVFAINYKVVQSEGLDDITESQATGWTVALAALLPVATLIGGTVVFVKRRHS